MVPVVVILSDGASRDGSDQGRVLPTLLLPQGYASWLPAALRCPPVSGREWVFLTLKLLLVSGQSVLCRVWVLQIDPAAHFQFPLWHLSCRCRQSRAGALCSSCTQLSTHTLSLEIIYWGKAQIKPCWARPYLTLIVFVIYGTTKWGGWWKKFCKVACNALILGCRRGSWTMLMKSGMLGFFI